MERSQLLETIDLRQESTVTFTEWLLFLAPNAVNVRKDRTFWGEVYVAKRNVNSQKHGK